MLGVRPNGDAAGAQRLHDGGVRSAVRGITVESLEIETDGEIDLRGFLGIDATVPPGYENLSRAPVRLSKIDAFASGQPSPGCGVVNRQAVGHIRRFRTRRDPSMPELKPERHQRPAIAACLPLHHLGRESCSVICA
jgi:hypothetical protein